MLVPTDTGSPFLGARRYLQSDTLINSITFVENKLTKAKLFPVSHTISESLCKVA